MDGGATGGTSHRFTVADDHRMADAGILNEDSRVELIRGQILGMAPVGAPHFDMVNRLTRVLSAILAGRGLVSVQNPFRLDDGSEPAPDVTVLRPRADDYETAGSASMAFWTSRPCPASLFLQPTCCVPPPADLALANKPVRWSEDAAPRWTFFP